MYFFHKKPEPVAPAPSITKDAWAVLVGVMDKRGFNALTAEERAIMAKGCQALLNDEVLNYVIDTVIGEQEQHIVKVVEDAEVLKMVRCSILGAERVRQRVKEIAGTIEVEEPIENSFEVT